MSAMLNMPNPLRGKSSSKAAHDETEKVEWDPAPESSKAALAKELHSLYWDGVRREIKQMILTLQEWRKPQYANVKLEEERNTPIEGFEHFVDQVSEASRDFAQKYDAERIRRLKAGKGIKAIKRNYLESSRLAFTAYRKKIEDQKLKSEIRSLLPSREGESTVYRRARMLLQSAAFLDVDKVVLYNSPQQRYDFWRRSAPPQLACSRFDASSMPVLKALRCKICDDVIRGVLFRCQEKNCVAPPHLDRKDSICETCFREAKHPQSHMTKIYKHLILREVISPRISRTICVCNPSSGTLTMALNGSLFPINKDFPHRGKNKTRVLKCGLLLLSDKVMEAKYEGAVSKIEKEKKRMQKRKETKENDQPTTKPNFRRRGVGKRVAAKDPQKADPQGKTDEKTMSDVEDEQQADKEIPFLYRKYARRYPFGNVHVALMFGPLMIENGVPDSNRGVLLSTRDPSSFGAVHDVQEARREMALSQKRTLYKRTLAKPLRRVKATMKQIVGDTFQGLSQPTLECEIIEALVSASDKGNPRRPFLERKENLKKTVDTIEELLKKLLDQRVSYVISQISERLFDLRLKLTWSRTSNNCQNFCDTMLPWDKVGNFLGPPLSGVETPNDISYMMSFVARPGSYRREKVVSKFDVPNGLTEEYLLRFRQGRHNDSDLIDTLQEYWHDWGGFGRTLYKYQNLFPWDCTMAYTQQTGTCNTCSLSNHVWSFPFDSYGAIRLHLTRQRVLYPPETAGEKMLSNEQWMRNRLTVLVAHDALLAATTAMYRSSSFRAATDWLHSVPHERVDRFKLGGIHRAQPFSHEFEKGRYHEYMLADWALLIESQQIERYEYLRDRRVLLANVELNPRDQDDGDGGDGGDGANGGDAGNTDDVDGSADAGNVGWDGTNEGDSSGGNHGVVDGWDGDYPDGYGDEAGDTADGGGFDGGLDSAFDADPGGDGDGGDGGGGGGDGGGGG